ncbi:MAG TPA: hypothetical protein VF692_03290 [Pyrinomonadaceae bacterium]
MKKLLTLSLLSLSALVFVPSAEAKASTTSALTANSAAPQISVQIGRGNRRRVNRRAVRTYTRNVRQGRAIYRETYRVVYRPNGTTRTQLISRVRVGRY